MSTRGPDSTHRRLVVSTALVLGLVLAIAAGGTAVLAQQTDWPQYRLDPSHAGFNPAETTLGPTTVPGLQQRWTVTLGPGGNALGIGLVTPATVVDGVIYQHSAFGFLYALDSATGAELWNAPTGGYGSSQPAVANGVVYVGTVYGVRAYPTSCSTPCQPLWTALPELTFNPPITLKDGVLYAGGYDGRLYALDASTGNVIWSADVNVDFFDPVWGPPAVVDGVVYQPADIGVKAYPTTCQGPGCKPLWIRRTDFSVSNSPAVADGVVYAVDDQGMLMALDAKNGRPIWTAATSFSPKGPVVGDGTVFLATGDGRLWAFPTDCHGSHCDPLWRTIVGQALFEPVVANGVVYVGSLNFIYLKGTIYAFPTTCTKGCQPLFSQAVDGAIESAPVVVNGVVYAGTLTGQLYSFGLP